MLSQKQNKTRNQAKTLQVLTRTTVMEMEARNPQGGWGRGTLGTGPWGLKPKLPLPKTKHKPEDKGLVLHAEPWPADCASGCGK